MYPLLLCSFSLLFSLSTLPFSAASERLRGFSLDQIHHDSLLSPFDDNSASDVTFELNIDPTKYSYLISLDVTTEGHPTLPIQANLDTGSSNIWLNGKGCKGNACFCDNMDCIQKPNRSPCQVCDMCREINKHEPADKCSKEKICPYTLQYGDEFTTEGVLTQGKFWLPIRGVDHSSKDIDIWLGVSHRSEGPLNKNSTGIVGLGRGELSLVSQLRAIRVQPKFSYCLPRPNSTATSKLLLGSQVTISSNFAPLLKDGGGCDDHYCVRLASVSLNGGAGEEIYVEQENSIMFIDSGSTFTYLNEILFPKFIKEVLEITRGNSIPLGTYSHCFKQEDAKNLKEVSFQFYKGVTVNLKEVNFFDEKKDDHGNVDYLCLTVKERKGTDNFLGNRAQIDFKVAISLYHGEYKVSFDEENCSGEQNVEEPLDFQE